MQAKPFYVAGEPADSDDVVTIHSPYDGHEVGRTSNATPDQVAFYVDLLKKVRETPEWKKLMSDGAFNQSFMTGDDYAKWVDNEDKRHQALMKEAGFLAGQ